MTRRAAVALVGVALASGCIVARVDLTVDPQGMVDGTAAVAYRIAYLDAAGRPAADAQEALLVDLTDDGVDGLACLPFRDAETIGASCTLTDVPVAELSQLDVFDRRLAIARIDDRLVLDAVIDLTEFAPDPANELDAVVTVAFAGPIVEQRGGAMTGTTVSWRPHLGERLEAHAVAEAAPGDAPSGAPIALLATGAVAVVAAGALLVVLAARRPR